MVGSHALAIEFRDSPGKVLEYRDGLLRGERLEPSAGGATVGLSEAIEPLASIVPRVGQSGRNLHHGLQSGITVRIPDGGERLQWLSDTSGPVHTAPSTIGSPIRIS